MSSFSDVAAGQPMALVHFARDCARAAALRRGDRTAGPGDVLNLLATMGLDTAALTPEWVIDKVFSEPGWEWRGLTSALRRRDKVRSRRPQMVRLYHLVPAPAKHRWFDRLLESLQRRAEGATA